MAIVAGVIVGLAGVLVGYVGGAKDRQSVRELADRDRHQERLADAYIALLEMAEKMGVWAASVRRKMIPPGPEPELPAVDNQISVTAKVNAYGSDAVREKMAVWERAVQAVVSAHTLIDLRLELPIDTRAARSLAK